MHTSFPLHFFHIINDTQRAIVFNSQDLTVKTVPKKTGERLLWLQNLTASSPGTLISPHTTKRLKDALSAPLATLFPPYLSTGGTCPDISPSAKKTLRTLSINTTGTCNLRCCYCYANYGGFQKQEKLSLEQSTIDATIEKFYGLFDYIHAFQFMGGEPSLNIDAIEYTCNTLDRLSKKGAIQCMPRFSIVTNGTLLTERLLDLYKTYNVNITVSLDGPKPIHDLLRRKEGGDGTFVTIYNNVKKMRKHGINVQFECTFTKLHLNTGYTIPILMDFFFNEMGISSAHIAPVSGNCDEVLALDLKEKISAYEEGLHYALQNLKKGIPKTFSFFNRIANAFKNKRAIPNYCPAGNSLLSVACDGNIYPCFMLTDTKPLWMGNVKDNSFPSLNTLAVSNVLKRFSKNSYELCKNCWAKSLCFGCMGGDYKETKDIRERPNCLFIKSFIEKFLILATNHKNSG